MKWNLHGESTAQFWLCVIDQVPHLHNLEHAHTINIPFPSLLRRRFCLSWKGFTLLTPSLGAGIRGGRPPKALQQVTLWNQRVNLLTWEKKGKIDWLKHRETTRLFDVVSRSLGWRCQQDNGANFIHEMKERCRERCLCSVLSGRFYLVKLCGHNKCPIYHYSLVVWTPLKKYDSLMMIIPNHIWKIRITFQSPSTSLITINPLWIHHYTTLNPYKNHIPVTTNQICWLQACTNGPGRSSWAGTPSPLDLETPTASRVDGWSPCAWEMSLEGRCLGNSIRSAVAGSPLFTGNEYFGNVNTPNRWIAPS